MAKANLELSLDPIDSSIHEIVTFFGAEMADVTFPDVDAGQLHDAAEQVRARAQDLVRARQVLEEVQKGLEEATVLLDDRARQALAYAQVFAASRPALAKQVEKLALAKKKPRPRRSASSTAATARPKASESARKGETMKPSNGHKGKEAHAAMHESARNDETRASEAKAA